MVCLDLKPGVFFEGAGQGALLRGRRQGRSYRQSIGRVRVCLDRNTRMVSVSCFCRSGVWVCGEKRLDDARVCVHCQLQNKWIPLAPAHSVFKRALYNNRRIMILLVCMIS